MSWEQEKQDTGHLKLQGLQTYRAEFGEEMRVWGEGWWKVLSRVFQNKCREFVLKNKIIKFSQSD